jgi:hypothetical protein
VSIANPVDCCPLCFSSLTQKDNEPEMSSYPALLEQAERYIILQRVLVMLSLAVSVVCLTVNILTYSGLLWSLIVIGNILYIWVAISTAVKKRARIGFNVLIQALCLAALLVLIDFLSGRSNWALNYVVPFLFVTATMSITVITIVKRLDTRSFILYFFLIALLGFIPILLLALKQATVLWPSLVSAMYSGLSLVSLFVFAYRATKQELRKRFHL